MHASTLTAAIALCSIAASGCIIDPVYVEPADALEAGGPNADPEVPASASFTLPIRLEEDDEAMARGERAAELEIEVPYITIDDLEISMEWSIRNLGEEPANVRILLNGANEYFAYVPISFVVDPEEEPTPPPLLGDIPLLVPAAGSLEGVFREDQLREAAIDLDLITRAGLNPFAAMLQDHDDLEQLEPAAGAPIPISAVPHLIRFDLSLLSDREVVMKYVIRLRSRRSPNLVHDKGVNAPAGELTVFAPADFVPPPPDPDA